MRSIEVNVERWPLVVVVFDGTPTQRDFDAFLGATLGILHRKQKHAYIVDARKGTMLPREMRQQQGEWLKTHKALIQSYSLGSAVVLKSSVLRFVLATIYLIQPPVSPTENFTTIEEATAWIQKILKAAGLSVPN
jgi:hypothetical protein